MNCIKSALSDAIPRLTTDNPHLDAEVLLAHTLKVPRSWLRAHPEALIAPDDHASYDKSIEQVSSGYPLPYVVGHWEFYGLDFKLAECALIPRPETEMLVEHALDPKLSDRCKISIADIGTGNGIIAITLALNLPQAEITATDISYSALELALQNALKHSVADRITFVHRNLLADLGMFSMICANPPYIAEEELETLPVARHEPRIALDGGADGLHIIERLLTNAGDHLLPGGVLLVEIGADQGDASRAIAEAAFPNGAVQVIKDLACQDRLLIVRDESRSR